MHIAVVDNDPETIQFVRDIMQAQGHACTGFSDGMSALAMLRRDAFDILFLDWFLPDIGGLELLKRIKASNDTAMGIVMLTNQADKEAIADALRAGADDYIVKPETASVILARAEAIFRRIHRADDAERIFQSGNYCFDRLTETISFKGQSISLSAKEFALALLLFDNIHRPLSRGYILKKIWHANPDLSTRTLDMHISRIRSKLDLRPENGFQLAAVSGYGYRLERFHSEGDVWTDSCF